MRLIMTEASAKTTYHFQAEAKQLLHLMIHSLYSNKEIFLRELISNASDAADKLRYEALQNPELMEGDPDLKVWINIDKEAKTLTIRDNGIGMSRKEVIENLGTIAKSGTRDFLNRLTGDEAKDIQLIGQFGVGFYSSFIVADKVVVNTRRAGSLPDEGVCWSSKGEGNYELELVTCPHRGTEIVLHLKPAEEEFLNDWRLKNVITKYSDHLTLPVVMKNAQNEEETVNRVTALWTLPKSEITDEQYKELYKHISHDFEDPLVWSHNKVEGKTEYTSLVYIPKRAPFDLWRGEKPHGLKLYVKRVFIMDDVEQFLPHYLRFVRGILDCQDLSLNVSREILQHDRLVDTIKTAITKRVLGMLEELAEDKDKYQIFWKAFGQVLKEGYLQDLLHKEQIASLLRFSSTYTNDEAQTVSLEEYIQRMAQKQSKIYYITAQNFTAAKSSPQLEIFRKNGIEVLLLTDQIDEWLVAQLTTFKDKSWQSVTKKDLDLSELIDKVSEEEQKQSADDFAETLKKIQENLKNEVKEVRLSQRLTDSPACIVSDEEGFNPQMQVLMGLSGQTSLTQKLILELNPHHSMVKRLKTEQDLVFFEDWAHILLDQAILAEGRIPKDPARFVQRFNQLLVNLP